jgi:hypothetical protein
VIRVGRVFHLLFRKRRDLTPTPDIYVLNTLPRKTIACYTLNLPEPRLQFHIKNFCHQLKRMIYNMRREAEREVMDVSTSSHRQM